MKNGRRVAHKKTYSLRSQASWREQWGLEDELRKNEAWLRVAEQNVKRLSESKEQVTRHMATSGNVQPSYLGDLCRQLDDETRRLAVHKDQKASLQSRIKALTQPSRSQAAKRLKNQRQLGALASERLSMDRLIGCAVGELRRLLKAREELSVSMHAGASAIDLQGRSDLLDESRFATLLGSLPADLTAQSERWVARFTGEQDGKRKYVVRQDRLTLDEILSNCHCYARGDSIDLTEEEARGLLASGSVDEPDGAEPASPEVEMARNY